MVSTTVRLEKKTKEALKELRNFEQEPFDSVIGRIVRVAKEDSLGDDELVQIEKSLEDIKKGRFLSLDEAEKKWGI